MTIELAFAVLLVAAAVSAAVAGLCAHLLWLALTSPRELIAALASAWKAVSA